MNPRHQTNKHLTTWSWKLLALVQSYIVCLSHVVSVSLQNTGLRWSKIQNVQLPSGLCPNYPTSGISASESLVGAENLMVANHGKPNFDYKNRSKTPKTRQKYAKIYTKMRWSSCFINAEWHWICFPPASLHLRPVSHQHVSNVIMLSNYIFLIHEKCFINSDLTWMNS